MSQNFFKRQQFWKNITIFTSSLTTKSVFKNHFKKEHFLEIKITVFTCLLRDEGCNSFSKHLDLALAPNETNEGVKKQ